VNYTAENLKTSLIKCTNCGEVEEYLDDETLACLPDGLFIDWDSNKWICLECGYKLGYMGSEDKL
jgi:hypothetical protein